MREKDFQSKFTKWLRYNHHVSGVFELKLAKGKSLPFDAVKSHQLEALLNASTRFIVYKIPDDTIGQKPFDCFKIVGVRACVAVLYEHSKQDFFIIPVENFVKEKALGGRKSLTDIRANEIGYRCHFNEIKEFDE